MSIVETDKYTTEDPLNGFYLKIVNLFPPNYGDIVKKFPIRGRRDVVFTYGDKLYNPYKGEIPIDLLIHEKVHSIQQSKQGKVSWWEQYLEDKQFRLEQELEAYQAQYKYALDNYEEKYTNRLLEKVSDDLSSSLYGGIITKKEALNKIKKI